ncbi:MAG TPA: AAA family ATPase [Clostridiales bacterium]|nr:AAA family ATPase [Clostridiales bacterium]
MFVKTLKAENFRNLERIELEPSEGVNIIYGENAQGKTNLLEPIWLFTGFKSFRGAKDSSWCASARISQKRKRSFSTAGECRRRSL